MPPNQDLKQGREDVLAGAYPGADWTGYDPSRWWETSGIPGGFFESEYAKSLAPPAYASSYGLPESGTSGQFYDWYQGLDAGDQGVFSNNPYDVLQTTAPDLPQFDLEERDKALARQEGMYNELNPFYTERMDPEWSMFGPEARGALERRIANQLAVAQRDITGDLRRRGIFGSGIEAQLEMDAQNIAAGATADMRGQISMADELARERAATGLEGMRQFGARGLTDLSYQMAGLGPEMARLYGPMAAAGPYIERMDALGIYDLNEQKTFLERELQRAREEANPNAVDVLESLLDMWDTGFSPINALGHLGG